MSSWDIGRTLDWAAAYLRDRELSPSPRLDVELLLAKVLDCKRLDLYLHYQRPLEAQELSSFKTLFMRRRGREPVAHILGTKEFMGLSFKSSPAALIPRPETELLVELVEAELKDSWGLVYDVGTGSGCLAISLLQRCPQLSLSAWDWSEEALALAQENVLKLLGPSLGQRLSLERKDMLAEASWQNLERATHLVANPPYISHEEIKALSPEILLHEPMEALRGGEDGLLYYRALASFAPKALQPQGRMLLEIGEKQGAAVEKILQERAWNGIKVHEDYSGRARVVEARCPLPLG